MRSIILIFTLFLVNGSCYCPGRCYHVETVLLPQVQEAKEALQDEFTWEEPW